MKRNEYTTLDQLPIFLNADQVSEVLGISRAKAYQLMHTEAFPKIQIGKRMVVRKEHFIAWIDKESGINSPNNSTNF